MDIRVTPDIHLLLQSLLTSSEVCGYAANYFISRLSLDKARYQAMKGQPGAGNISLHRAKNRSINSAGKMLM